MFRSLLPKRKRNEERKKTQMTQNERIFLPIWKKIIIILVTLVVFAFQIAIFAFLFQVNFSGSLNIWIYLSIELIAFIVVFHIVHKPIMTSYKLTWSILILLIPLPFLLLYYLNHRSRQLPKRKQKKVDAFLETHQLKNDCIEEVAKIDAKAARIARVLNQTTKFPLYKNTEVSFLPDGAVKFDDLLKELKLAQSYIFIESFIIGEGYVLKELFPLLKEKGTQGVTIKILYDDLGSAVTLKRKTIKEFTKIPNCVIVNYNPLGLNINPAFNYRDHRKIIVIDGRVAYCGGDNLADEYIHKKQRFGFWRDNCAKYTGDAVKSFVAMFAEMWYMSTKEILSLEESSFPANPIVNNGSFVLPFGDGPSNVLNPGYEIFKFLITTAEKTLYISTPYFIIDDDLIHCIVAAVKSGVDVRILMPGIPDKKLAFYLAHYCYRDILAAGGKIYEFTPGFNHAKNIIVDGKYAFIGTINMDYRSLFLHYECGAVILLDDEISKMQADYLQACEQSRLIVEEDYRKRPWWEKLISYILYLFMPLF